MPLVKPGGSMFHAGTWCPGKNEIQTIRYAPSFTSLTDFIPKNSLTSSSASRSPRSSIFSMEDELKVAPKGILKTHKLVFDVVF